MKFKNIIGLVIILSLIFIIYILNIDEKIYYVNISDDNTTYNLYIKKSLDKNSKLEKLAQFNIHQDMASIGRGNIDLIWDNDIAKLMINGEAENLYINIWIDNESNEFKYEYESNYDKTNTF